MSQAIEVINTTESDITEDYETTAIPGGFEFAGCIFTAVIAKALEEAITSCAFRKFTELTAFTLPDTLTAVGDRAFFECTSLTTLTLPDSLTSIGDYAFYGCGGLTSLALPELVTSLGDQAFCQCIGLTSLAPVSYTHLTLPTKRIV